MAFTEDLSSFFNTDEFATSVIYTSVFGISVSVDVIIVTGVTRIGFDSEISVNHDEVTFKNSDITDPKRNDAFDAAGTIYTMISEIANDGITSIWLVKNG